jgi:glutamine synthetase
MKRPGFIERHHLWTEIQQEASDNIKAVVKERDLLLIRTAWADQQSPTLPKSLPEAISYLSQSELFSQKMGQQFINFIIKMKESEINRFLQSVADQLPEDYLLQVTNWEQREYFELF